MPHSSSLLAPVEQARHRLGLSYLRVARLVGADETTLHRWRRGAVTPSPVFAARLAALGAFLDALDRAGAAPTAVRAWLGVPTPLLGGRRPLEALEAGELGLVTGLLVGGAVALDGAAVERRTRSDGRGRGDYDRRRAGAAGPAREGTRRVEEGR
jgi:transcriptional regulator with XRE-family HTH domain